MSDFKGFFSLHISNRFCWTVIMFRQIGVGESPCQLVPIVACCTLYNPHLFLFAVVTNKKNRGSKVGVKKCDVCVICYTYSSSNRRNF